MITYKIVFPQVNKPKQETIMAILLNKYDVEGFEEFENELFAYINLEKNELENVNFENFETNYFIEKIEAQNWNAVWESNFDPVIVDEFCCIRAHFHEINQNAKFEIIITPKMSFGTGHHATTYQVIKAMEQLEFNNKKVADYGTGTGVLAILAEKLGAIKIDAIDNDDWSIENTIENIEKNNVSNIAVIKDITIPNEVYDIILANINKNVLLQEMNNLSNALVNNGVLLLSGILKEDLKDMEKCIILNQLTINNITEKNNWLCIKCTKNL
jgi:ribosomal protein L11 methyltransferase